MTRIRIIGLALVAVFAFAAVATATASAVEPEWVYTGTEKGFTGKQAGSGTLETKSGLKVTCTGGSSSGAIGNTGTKTVTEATIKFTGCEHEAKKCQTGAVEGEIETKKVSGELGYVSKATTPHEVGILLKPKEGTVFVVFKCGIFEKEEVTGSIIGKITPVGKKVKTTEHFTLSYTQTKGVQAVKKFEGIVEEHFLKASLDGFPSEESGLQSTQELTPKSELEIKG
jgi:hypothetical protein